MSASTIQKLNDVFRQTFAGGRVVLTSGVSGLPKDITTKLLHSVKTHSKFTKDNDPNGEHDFGSCIVADEKFFWKPVDSAQRDMSSIATADCFHADRHEPCRP